MEGLPILARSILLPLWSYSKDQKEKKNFLSSCSMINIVYLLKFSLSLNNIKSLLKLRKFCSIIILFRCEIAKIYALIKSMKFYKRWRF
jgi:hypothetical protein